MSTCLSRFPGGTHTLHHTWVKHTELQPNLQFDCSSHPNQKFVHNSFSCADEFLCFSG